MKKNSTENRLLTGGLIALSIANFLIYAAVYMWLGVWPKVLPGVTRCIYPAFMAGMLLAGPFHAYLADTFRRKSVLLWAYAGVAAAVGAAHYVDESLYAWLAWILGASFALAVGAGTTIHIDITVSGRRTSGNLLFATCGRVGMVAGLAACVGGYGDYPLTYLTYAAVLMCGVAMLAASSVYVSFRAPIGMRLCSLDRFFLPRAWLPALNVGILSFAFGMSGRLLMDVSTAFGYFWMLPLLILPLLTPLWVKMFVKLSHHCQRATGNMTFNLLMDLGLVAGMWSWEIMDGMDKVLISEDMLILGGMALAVLVFVFATLPYYRKKRVR